MPVPQPKGVMPYHPLVFTTSPDHPLLHSSLLTDHHIAHGFTTRPLNITLADGPTLLAPFTQTPPHHITLTPQAHGCDTSTPDVRALARKSPDAAFDAHISTTADHPVAVRTADCIPLLIATADGEVVAAIHAGWRGLVAGTIPAALNEFARFTDAPPRTWLAALGPCISVTHYQVGEEVAQHFDPTHLRRDLTEKPHLDLRSAAAVQLSQYHLAPDHIDIYPGCTFVQPELLPSYRRDGRGCGHLAAFIQPGV